MNQAEDVFMGVTQGPKHNPLYVVVHDGMGCFRVLMLHSLPLMKYFCLYFRNAALNKK